MADNNRPLPRANRTEDQEPTQEQFDFGSMAEDFRSSDEIQKDLLTKIFNSIFDISKNVSIITNLLPDLISLQSDINKSGSSVRDRDDNPAKDDLEQQEKDRESMVQSLKQSGAGVIKNTAEGVFGFFEKIFAILTPMLFGMLLAFTDLTNPLELLKDALIGLALFMSGKFVYQMIKSLSLTMISKLLERFSGPKIINAPNSIINAGGVGSTGGATGGKGKGSGRTGPVATGTSQGGLSDHQRARYDQLRSQNVPAKTAYEQAKLIAREPRVAPITPSATPIATPTSTPGAASRALGGLKTFGGKVGPLALATALISAPTMFAMKKEEGKSNVRAGAETAASTGGGLVGGVLAGAATGAALGALGANPFTVALGGAIGAIAGGIVGEEVASSFTEKVFNFFSDETSAVGTAEKGFLFSNEYAAMTPEERSKIKISQEDYAQFNKVHGITPVSQLKTEDLIKAQKETITAREKPAAVPASQNISVSTGGTAITNTTVNHRALQAEENPASRGLGAKG